jgi:hypothetical protein
MDRDSISEPEPPSQAEAATDSARSRKVPRWVTVVTEHPGPGRDWQHGTGKQSRCSCAMRPAAQARPAGATIQVSIPTPVESGAAQCVGRGPGPGRLWARRHEAGPGWDTEAPSL